MITVTAAQQSAIDAGRFKHFARFTLGNSSTLTIGEDEIWDGGFSVDQSVSGQSAFELGACVVNEFKVDIYNPNGAYHNTDFLGDPVYAYIELYDTDNTTVIGEISKGHYIVTEADTNGEMIKLTCLDAMTLLDRPYSDVTITYPATLYQIASAIATTCGLTLVVDSSWIPSGIGSSYTVTEKTENNMTCRDMLSQVCQATANYATIDRLGQLHITRYDTAFMANTSGTYTSDYHDIDTSVLTKLERDEAQVFITGVSVTADEETYTAGTSDYMVYLNNNVVINSGSEQTFATALNNVVNGWNFRPFDADILPNMLVEAGDNAVVTDTLGNVYKTVITHVEYKAHNSMSIDCEAEPAAVNGSTRYSQAAQAASREVKIYDKTVNNYIDLVSKGYGMYRSLITNPDDSTQQIYAFHDAETLANSLFMMYEGANGIKVGKRDATTDPWVYSSAEAEDAVLLARTLVANTAIVNEIFTHDITVTGQLHSDDYVWNPSSGSVYASAGMGLDFDYKLFNTPYFAIDPQGKIYASMGTIGPMRIGYGHDRPGSEELNDTAEFYIDDDNPSSLSRCYIGIRYGQSWLRPGMTSIFEIYRYARTDTEATNKTPLLSFTPDGNLYVSGQLVGTIPTSTLSGQVPITKGGTGASTVEGARDALGLGNTSGALPIANGGTGADNLADAQTNLGISTINSTLSHINTGVSKTNGGTVSVPTGTWTVLQQTTLAAGTWLVIGGAAYSANSTGQRSVILTVSSTAPSSPREGTRVAPNPSNVTTNISMTEVYTSSSSFTVYLWGVHNAGTSLNAFPYIHVVQLR